MYIILYMYTSSGHLNSLTMKYMYHIKMYSTCTTGYIILPSGLRDLVFLVFSTLNVRTYMYIERYQNTCTCTCNYNNTYICMHVYTYVHVRTCTHVHVCADS